MEYWKITVAIFPSRQNVFPSELLKLLHQSPQIGNTRKYLSSRAGPIRVQIPPWEYWASSRSQYKKILQAHGVNTRKYWLVEVIENDCIVTQVRVYNGILPVPSGNPSASALGISFGLRQYFIVYSSSRHNTVTIREDKTGSSFLEIDNVCIMSRVITVK